MLLKILLLSFVLSSLTNAKSSPKLGLDDLENLVDKLVESRLRDMETRMQDDKEKQAKEKKELEAKVKAMEIRLKELEYSMKEEKDELNASKLRMEVENVSNNALTNPSLRDLPIVIISAYRDSAIESPQTVTFESFLANYNNGDRPGGGSGVLDLDSGVFTCATPGYYTVSFSAHGVVGPSHPNPELYLYIKGSELPESEWYLTHAQAVDTYVGVTGSRILVSNLFEMFA